MDDIIRRLREAGSNIHILLTMDECESAADAITALLAERDAARAENELFRQTLQWYANASISDLTNDIDYTPSPIGGSTMRCGKRARAAIDAAIRPDSPPAPIEEKK